jgi:hypothetical protein
VLGGRFVEPEVTAGVTPRVEIASDEVPVRRAPLAAVKPRMGQLESEMTVAQWKLFTDSVGKVLVQEGLLGHA